MWRLWSRRSTLGPITLYPFRTHDGESLTAVVTAPRGKPVQRRAAIVLASSSLSRPGHVHFDLLAQALAAQGYAFMQVGAAAEAGGEGEHLLFEEPGEIEPAEAENQSFGDRQQSSLSDAVAFLATQGVIDTTKVCIEGKDFGGDIALRSITTPGKPFRCAIGVEPVVNLKTEIRYPDQFTRSPGFDRASSWRAALGKEKLNPAALRVLSPIYHADRASGPILLIHERIDMNAVERDPERMRDALQRIHKSVTTITLDPAKEELGAAAGREKALNAIHDFLAIANPPF